MKIREIRCAGLRGATPEGGWTEELRSDDCVHTLVAVHTEEGAVGIGSVFSNDALVQAALQVMEPLYRGEWATEPERVSEKLRQNTFWLGRGGTLTHTISGIDIALWDLLGQVTGQSIGRLMGGRYRERVQPYASLLMDEPAILNEHLLQVKSQGFKAFKIGWGPFGRRDAATDRSIVQAARSAVGDDCKLMVDAGASDAFWPHGYKWALNTSHMLADYGVEWFEEPLNPDALDDFIKLREHSPVPIAGGEVLTRRQSFQPWIDQGAFDVVQPDVTKVGGLSEMRYIARSARAHGVKLVPHGWNTAIGMAADLQLASAMPDVELVEYITGSPFIDELPLSAWRLDEAGMLTIPDKPGLGVQLNPEALEKYSSNKKLFDPD